MRKRLLSQATPLFRKLRQLSLLLTFLLALPLTAWGQDPDPTPATYGIIVAGTEVNSNNRSDILTESNAGKVSYNPDTNTLMLNGVSTTGAIEYSGTTELVIALSGTNSIGSEQGNAITTSAAGAAGNIKITKAESASSAELTATGTIASVTTLGTGLYWKPTAGNTMVITEDPEFVIVDGVVVTETVTGTQGTITYNSNEKTLTLNAYEKDFTASHAIKTGVTGLKVKLIGASTIKCSADSAVFHAFSSSASIQFIKDDATSKLTMEGTAFDNFGDGNVTYDGLFYYEGTDKYITQPLAPELAFEIKDDGKGNSYTYATIKYAQSERAETDETGNTAVYSSTSPVRKYSFDYADPSLTDVAIAEYPSDGIKMTSPGILTAWVEVSGIKSAESKGVRYGIIENPIVMEFDGQEKAIDITPAPIIDNVQPNISVNGNSASAFEVFASLDANNRKITVKNCCAQTNIGFSFGSAPTGYTSLNSDTTIIAFYITPPKPTISVVGGTYDEPLTVTIASNYQGTGAAIKYTLGNEDNLEYSTALTISETKTLTAWVEVNGAKSDTVQAPYTIRQDAGLNYSAETATARIIGDEATLETLPYLNNESEVEVTYSSSNTAVATIDNQGAVTIVGAGTTTISAKPTNETTYIPTPASYILTVTRVIISPFANAREGQIFATYYSPAQENLALPTGLAAYIVTGVSGTSVTTTAINYLPAEQPILLEKTGDIQEELEMAGYDGTAGNFSSNKLRYVSLETGESASGSQYVLYMNEFVKATEMTNIGMGSCYLDLTGVSGSRGMYGIGDDGSTAIEGIRQEVAEDTQWYDLQGRRIQKPTKAGLYIKNGKKIVVNNK